MKFLQSKVIRPKKPPCVIITSYKEAKMARSLLRTMPAAQAHEYFADARFHCRNPDEFEQALSEACKLANELRLLASFSFVFEQIPNERKLTLPPGSKLQKAASFIFSSKTMVRVFDTIFQDLQYEYFEALQAGHTRKARWIHIRGVLSFWNALCQQIGFSFVKVIASAWNSVK